MGEGRKVLVLVLILFCFCPVSDSVLVLIPFSLCVSLPSAVYLSLLFVQGIYVDRYGNGDVGGEYHSQG